MMTDDDKDFLVWIHDRLEHVHGENRHSDYMLKLRQLAGNAEIPSEEEVNDAPKSKPRIGPRSELEENELENRFLKKRFSEMEKEIKELRHTIFVLKCALKAVL